MKSRIKAIKMAGLCLFTSGCATRIGVLNNPLPEVRSAAVTVAKNLNWSIDSSNGKMGDTIQFKSKYGLVGYIRLKDLKDTATQYQACVYPYSITSEWSGSLFVEFTKQQIEIEKGTTPPHKNEKKGYARLLGKNIVSPAWGTSYAFDSNVFYPTWIKTSLVTSYILSDIISLSLVTQGGIERNSNEIASGLIVAGIFRILGMTNAIYAANYNRYAHLEYDFGKIKYNF